MDVEAFLDHLKQHIGINTTMETMKLLLTLSLLISLCCLSQAKEDKQNLSRLNNACALDGDIKDTCQEIENDVDAEKKLVPDMAAMVEKKKKERLSWQDLDWPAYQALDLTPEDKEQPIAR